MSKQVKIENLSKGATSIPADTINAVIDGVNIFNGTQRNTQTYKVSSSTGKDELIQPSDEKLSHPFRIAERYANVIAVEKSSWVRDQTEVKLTIQGNGSSSAAYADPDNDDVVLYNVDDFANGGSPGAGIEANVDYYVYVKLQANTNSVTGTTLDFDPTLIPGELQLYVDKDRPTADARTPAEAYATIATQATTPRDFWVKDQEVIGTVQLDTNGADFFIKEIKQLVSIDIEDYQIVPDGLNKFGVDDAANVVSSHARYTIETNPSADTDFKDGTIHFGELQLKSVDKCPGFASVAHPFFLSSETNNTAVGPAGRVEWSSIDSHYYPLGANESPPTDAYKTLQVWTDGDTDHFPESNQSGSIWTNSNSFSLTSLYNVSTTRNDSYSICYYESGDTKTFSHDGWNYSQTTGELKWATIDSHTVDDTQFSIEVTNTSGYSFVQLKDFDDAVNSVPDDNIDLILYRDATGPTLKYMDANTAWQNFISANTGGECGPGASISNHTDLVDIVAGNYKDDDHPGHWNNKDAVAGRNSGANDGKDDYTKNNGESIGNDSAQLVVDLNNEKLFRASSTFTIDWDGCEMQNTVGDKKWDVVNGTRFVVNNASVTLASIAFQSTGGGYFGSNSGLTSKLGGVSHAGWGTSSGLFERTNLNAVLCNATYAGIFNYIGDTQALIGSTSIAGTFTNFNGIGAGINLATTAYAADATTGSYNAVTGAGYYVNGTQIITDRQAAIADIGGGAANSDGTCRDKVDAILAMLRTHGLIAP